MTENKNLEELRNELEQSKQEKIQLEHQIQKKKNQLSYRENFSRKERSHRLIVCGAIFEKYFPVVKDLSEKELSEVLSSVNVTAFGRELDRAIEQMRKEVTEQWHYIISMYQGCLEAEDSPLLNQQLTELVRD